MTRREKMRMRKRECLAVINAIKRFSHYLEGRWALKLQAYDFEIQHRPGRVHKNADSLSRTTHESYVMPVEVVKNDNGDDTYTIPIHHDKMRQAQRQDRFSKRIYVYIQFNILPNNRDVAKRIAAESHKYTIRNGLLYYVKQQGLPDLKWKNYYTYHRRSERKFWKHSIMI